jgi:hypothetical protein
MSLIFQFSLKILTRLFETLFEVNRELKVDVVSYYRDV